MTEKEQKLEKLFKKWMEFHTTNKWSTGFTLPYVYPFNDKYPEQKVKGLSEDFCKSFCFDGFLRPPVEGRKTLLFICRQADITDHVRDGVLMPVEQDEKNCPERFWMKDQFARGEVNPYTRLLLHCAGEYGGVDNLNLAYMNLNKRGGLSVTATDNIRRYADLHWHLICEEIKIISPDVIVCGGTFDHMMSEILFYDNVPDPDNFRCKLITDLGKDELEFRCFRHPPCLGPEQDPGELETKGRSFKLLFGEKRK